MSKFLDTYELPKLNFKKIYLNRCIEINKVEVVIKFPNREKASGIKAVSHQTFR